MNQPLKVHPGLVGSSCGHVAVLPSGMVWLGGMPWVSGCEVKVTVWLPPILACGPEVCLVVSGLGVASGAGVAVAVVGCAAAAGDCGVAEGDGEATGVAVPVGAVRPSSEVAG